MSRVKENILIHGILPLAECVMGTCATKWYEQICVMNTWSRDEILQWQNLHLQQIVRHAYDHTRYYRSVMDSLGLKPEDILTADDLRKLPIVTKEIVNAHYDEFIPDNLANFRYRKGKTGGTTGEPMLYLCDEDTWGYVTAAKIYYWRKAGWEYGAKFAALGSASLFGKKASLPRRIYDKIRNEVPMNSVNLNDELCEKYIARIIREHIHYIYGYAASIYILAQYVQRMKIDVPEIRAIFTTSENLPDNYRQLMEEVFHCRVVDCYGARDGGITGYETAYHNYEVGYNSIVETVEELEPGCGTAATTNLFSYSFPLIRYCFGDVVRLDQSEDDQSYNGQVITQVIGRTADIMRLENGRNLTATGFAMIMKAFDVVAFRVNKTDENEVTMWIQRVPEKYTEKQETNIRETIGRYIGADCNFIIQYVEHFDALPNGKRRYFMN